MSIFQGSDAFEDTPCYVLARFCAISGTGAASPIETEGNLIKKADVSAIACKVYDESNTLIITTTPTISTSIYDTLQTTGVLAKIARGGNFLYQIPATGFPTGNTRVTVEITVTLVGGEPVRSVWDIPVLNLNQS